MGSSHVGCFLCCPGESGTRSGVEAPHPLGLGAALTSFPALKHPCLGASSVMLWPLGFSSLPALSGALLPADCPWRGCAVAAAPAPRLAAQASLKLPTQKLSWWQWCSVCSHSSATSPRHRNSLTATSLGCKRAAARLTDTSHTPFPLAFVQNVTRGWPKAPSLPEGWVYSPFPLESSHCTHTGAWGDSHLLLLSVLLQGHQSIPPLLPSLTLSKTFWSWKDLVHKPTASLLVTVSQM